MAVGADECNNFDLFKPLGAGNVISASLISGALGSNPLNIILNGVELPRDYESTNPGVATFSSVTSDATAAVAPLVDGFPDDQIYTINYCETGFGTNPEGSVLWVVYEDMNIDVTNGNSVVFFNPVDGSDSTTGSFEVVLGEPYAGTDIYLSLGIAFSYVSPTNMAQFSVVTVDGQVLSAVAGGHEFGYAKTTSHLLTVGGFDDDVANMVESTLVDDELYTLNDFLTLGQTSFTVSYENPSNDDYIFFAALIAEGQTVQVGQILVCSASASTSPLNTDVTVTCLLTDTEGMVLAGVSVNFLEALNGITFNAVTDASGSVSFTFQSPIEGTDPVSAFTETAAASPVVITFEMMGSGDGDPHFTGFHGEHMDVVHDSASADRLCNLFCAPDASVNVYFAETVSSILFMSQAHMQFGDERVSFEAVGGFAMTLNGETTALRAGQVLTSGKLRVEAKSDKFMVVTYNSDVQVNVKAATYTEDAQVDDVPYLYVSISAKADAFPIVDGLLGQTLHQQVSDEEFAQFQKFVLAKDASVYECGVF